MGKHILLVEGNCDGRESTAALLTLWGYHVDGAETGKHAIELVTSHCPDIVILDLGLPDMRGEAVAAVMKTAASPPFIIAYTGYHRLEADARKAGCDAFILKPRVEGLKELLATAPERGKKASTDAA